MAKESDNEIDLSKETVDLSSKGDKEPKASSGSGSIPILEAGNDFAGYRIIRKIAHGAMGVVYLAEDPKLRRKVALKVILTVPGMQATDDQVNRFLREAQSIAKLRHKRIVPVYEVNSFENCHYFTMEYIEGPTLEQYLVKNNITAAKAIEIVLGIAEGLQEAHEKGIVHRDIKPANIIMQNGESPMITDFGLAKILEHEQKLTMTGSMLGTPCYMSPEQARGDSDLDYRSDVFSLGVLLYEMVTEKLPFKGESYMKTILMVINGDYVLPRKIKPRLSRDVESIIKKSLEKDREFRYENMIDFIDDCTRFQRGEVVTISRSGIYRKIFRNVVRQRNSILMSTIIVMIIGYLMYQNFDQQMTVTEQIQDKERTKEQASRKMEKINKEKEQLEQLGEQLKKGTTSPEFTGRFDNEKYFKDNWLTSWQPIVNKGSTLIPAEKNLIITPAKLDGFSSSTIFSWKMKVPLGNKFIFFCGKPSSDGKSIEKPVFISFQLIKPPNNAEGHQDRESHRKLRILFYQSSTKPIVDRTAFNAIEFINLMNPLAVKIYDLPENINESLNFSVKKHETFYEISVKEKDGALIENDKSFNDTFRVSSSSYLNPSGIQCGFFIPDTNKSSLDLEKFRVDKWITGTSENEINRIVENYGRSDFKILFSNLLKHREQLEKARYATENHAEITILKYQLAKTSFLMGIAFHRNLNIQTSKEDIKQIADCYEMALMFTQEYISSHDRTKKTEYVNYEDLYLSVLIQLAYLNIFQGDFIKAGELIKKHREITDDNTPYNNWLWCLPEPIEKYIGQIKVSNKLKLSEKYIEIFNFLRQFSFSSEAVEISEIRRFLKDMLKNCVAPELYDFDLFDKYNSLAFDDANKLFLQEIIIKEANKDIQKEKVNSLLFLSILKAVNKIFKIDESNFIGNYKYEKWSVAYPEKESRTVAAYLDSIKISPLTMRAIKTYPEFANAMNQNGEQGFERFNSLIESEAFRRKVLTNMLDELLMESRKKSSGEMQTLVSAFPIPIDINVEQNTGGNINLSLDDKGIRISLITRDHELKNKYYGNMVSQQDSWELYFDFRQEHQFLSNQSSPGLFKITYVPTPDENGLARFYSEENSIVSKLTPILFVNPIRVIPNNEIIFILPYSEISRITNNSNLKYFGFNAVLNLESKEKNNMKVLFPDVNKKLFYLTKNPGNVNAEPLLVDKDLINELVNVYQQFGDAFQDKIMVKKILDNWLNVTPLKPLVNDYQLKNIADDFLMVLNDNVKKVQVKKTIDDAALFFSVSGVFTGGKGHSQWKDLMVKNVMDKVINVLDLNFNLIEKKNKVPTVLDGEAFFEEVKRVRQLMKYSDASGRKIYWRFLEKFLNYLKENQPEVYENAHNFLMQLPESESNFREKAISCMLHGMIAESLQFLRKHLDSNFWKDDERVWYEFQVVYKMAGFMGVDSKISEEDFKEKNFYFAQLSQQGKNIENDCALWLDKKMKRKEFVAKYPMAEYAINLIDVINADSSPIRKVDEVKLAYENVLKTVTVPWLSSLLKRRIADLNK